MAYFDNFPMLNYTIGTGSNPVTVRNIFFRVKVLDSVRNNTLIYYPYYVKDGETPEDIAYKYYNDATMNWLVLMTNTILDPQFGWPLSYNDFISYMNAKYGNINNTYSTVHHYEMNIQRQSSAISSQPITTTFEIDYATYVATPEFSFQEVNLQDGTTVSITSMTSEVFVYDYEYQLNENKKQINLIANQYVSQIKQEFLSLAQSAQ